jgi:hypothetical protein
LLQLNKGIWTIIDDKKGKERIKNALNADSTKRINELQDTLTKARLSQTEASVCIEIPYNLISEGDKISSKDDGLNHYFGVIDMPYCHNTKATLYVERSKKRIRLNNTDIISLISINSLSILESMSVDEDGLRDKYLKLIKNNASTMSSLTTNSTTNASFFRSSQSNNLISLLEIDKVSTKEIELQVPNQLQSERLDPSTSEDDVLHELLSIVLESMVVIDESNEVGSQIKNKLIFDETIGGLNSSMENESNIEGSVKSFPLIIESVSFFLSDHCFLFAQYIFFVTNCFFFFYKMLYLIYQNLGRPVNRNDHYQHGNSRKA